MLKSMVPEVLLKIEEVEKILTIQGEELTKIEGSNRELLNQCYVLTATWGLDEWERFVGINTDKTKSNEFRRDVIIAKLRGQGTTTKALIKNIAESFSNGEVDVIEDNKNYSFIVKFVGVKGIPPNLDDLKRAIEEIKPAHLAALFEYTYNTWGQTQVNTWGNLKLSTWEQLKTR